MNIYGLSAANSCSRASKVSPIEMRDLVGNYQNLGQKFSEGKYVMKQYDFPPPSLSCFTKTNT
jgi:hypothetical protein